MEITREQAHNHWCYFVLKSKMELGFFMILPSIFKCTEEDYEQKKRIFHDDVQVKHNAELLANIINKLNLPEDGEENKYAGVMDMARAYVNYLDSYWGNPTYMNEGSFWLICCRIAKHVK